jgi:hypothetical protein
MMARGLEAGELLFVERRCVPRPSIEAPAWLEPLTRSSNR